MAGQSKQRNSRARPLAAGLDLGSTFIKAGLIDADGRLSGVASVPAPPLTGTGEIREGDAAAYLAAASELLDSIAEKLPEGTPLGVACQRSTFVLWDRITGRPRTAMISWQDRRATQWCADHADFEPEVVRQSGLPLSPHYAGPKLAALQAQDVDLGQALQDGELLFGNLDAFLVWQWSDTHVHETEFTMAARTAMVKLESGQWSQSLLDQFHVPRSILPKLVASSGRNVALHNGLILHASLADQASGALTVLAPEQNSVLVNLGTGAFVLRPADDASVRRPGYLTGPILGADQSTSRFALEGTINGAGPAVDRFGAGPTQLVEVDSCPDAFALPDLSGLGSPHWRPEFGLTLSPVARGLERPEQRRVVMEGLLFRVHEVLRDLFGATPPERVIVSGGLAQEPCIGQGLAALLERPVELLHERESTLLGVTRLAAGLPPCAIGDVTRIDPSPSGRYLPEKFVRWKDWFDGVLKQAGPHKL
jgi:glycerol kinase